MNPDGRKGLQRFMLMNVAEFITRHDRCSVQIVRDSVQRIIGGWKFSGSVMKGGDVTSLGARELHRAPRGWRHRVQGQMPAIH